MAYLSNCRICKRAITNGEICISCTSKRLAELEAEVERLQKDNDLIHSANLENNNDRKKWRREAQSLFEENQRLRKALELYADDENWESYYEKGILITWCRFGPQPAKDALKGVQL